MTAGDIYTVAGDGTRRAPATAARRPRPPYRPTSVAVDGTGNLIIADVASNNRIRVVAARTGRFYGRHDRR